MDYISDSQKYIFQFNLIRNLGPMQPSWFWQVV